MGVAGFRRLFEWAIHGRARAASTGIEVGTWDPPLMSFVFMRAPWARAMGCPGGLGGTVHDDPVGMEGVGALSGAGGKGGSGDPGAANRSSGVGGQDRSLSAMVLRGCSGFRALHGHTVATTSLQRSGDGPGFLDLTLRCKLRWRLPFRDV